jgi:ketosteroid isomerase-like protein
MSQENVETLRQSMNAFDRGDRPAWLALCDPDHEVVPVSDWPEAGAVRGREAVWDFYANVGTSFDPFDSGDAELMDAGGDKVVVHRGTELRGRASGVGVEFDYWIVVTIRDGKICRDQWFSDREEAHKAAGLRE